MLSFQEGLGAASRLTDDSGFTIQCVSLDDAVFGAQPNVIKMDVEGAEVSALIGGRKTIERFRPMLTISIYHTPAHLWEVLFLLSDWDLGYKFYMRSHGYQTFDTLLYAVRQ